MDLFHDSGTEHVAHIEKMINTCTILSEYLTEQDQLGDLGRDGTLILKYVLQTLDMMMWT